MLLKRYRYPWVVIERCVLLFINEDMQYREISAKMKSIGVEVSHKTIFCWVRDFSTKISKKKPRETTNYSVELTNIKCNGIPMFMYQAVNSKKQVVSFLLRKKKNLSVANKFFSQMGEKKV